MWSLKLRRYWHEGTKYKIEKNEAKARVKQIEVNKWLENKVEEGCRIIIQYYQNSKSIVDLFPINRQIITEILYENPLSSTDETIIDGCYKKLSEIGYIYFDNELKGDFFKRGR